MLPLQNDIQIDFKVGASEDLDLRIAFDVYNHPLAFLYHLIFQRPRFLLLSW